MSASGRPSPRSPADTAGTDRRVAGWLTVSVVVAAAVLLFFALAGQAGGVTGQAYQATENGSSDGEAPKLVEGARINDTAFELLITDNRDVDEGTIGASDFILEAGSISQVNATESGSNATVVVRLNRRVSIDDLTVAVAHGSDISDASGNTLDASASASSVVVSGMDGVPPAIRDFDATFRDGGPVFLSIRTSERLADLNVSVYGAVQDRLGGSDFAFNRSAYAYQTTYTPPEDGDVTFNLINATDENGNTAPVHMKEDVFVDTTPPEAVAGIDFSSSGNLTLAFDAGRSSDENGIASYEWAFGDGTTATGERVTHAFLPGNYTVSLSVVDNYGNVGTDSLELNLTAGAGNVTNVSEDRLAEIGGSGGPVVSVDRQRDGEIHSAFVELREAPGGQSIAIGRTDAALAERQGFALESLNVTLTQNLSARLGVSTDDAGSVATAASSTGTSAIGGITVVHDFPADAVENVTFAFAVDPDRIEAAGGSAANVSLRRFHDDSWNDLPTTVRNATNQTVYFSARSPGFSRFAIVTTSGAGTSESDQPTPTESPPSASDEAATPTATPTPEQRSNATSTSSPDRRQFAVTNVSLNRSTVAPGEAVLINATVENRGNTTAGFRAGLVVNATVVDGETVAVDPGQRGFAEFRYRTNETGTHRIYVNGTTADQQLTVGESGGGLLGSILGVFGFLPLGLLSPVVKFVVAPLAVVYLILKGLAIYLGY